MFYSYSEDFKYSIVHSTNSFLECLEISYLQVGHRFWDSSVVDSFPACFKEHSVNSEVEWESNDNLQIGQLVNILF